MKEKIGMGFKICFIAAVILFLAVSMAKAKFLPTETSMYEQRDLNRLPAFTVEEYLDSSFQTDTDTALGDQISFSTYFKKLYNELSSRADAAFIPLRHGLENRYVTYKGSKLFNGQLVAPMEPLDENKTELRKAAQFMNEKIALMPDIEFYFYYINNDTDINFETNERSGRFEFFSEELDLPAENIAQYPVADFEEYKENFYYSDHHWNNKGSYRAYLQLLEHLELDGEALVPQGELEIPGILRGSKARTLGSSVYYDRITVYVFDYPEIQVVFDGSPMADYGDVEAVIGMNLQVVTYADVYGYDTGCVTLSTNQPEKENILIVGDSYDNALLKLLSNHCNTLHAIDTRCFFFMAMELPDFEEYVKENNISKVLFCGSGDFFKELSKVEEW